ncbi:hypothetical protein PBT90_20360 [Algoriphagus halophytocola]|uniref:hypothetical protein n=1 Tax=Algoriphagus halophytocola TaxID=2991499 RepID=UPI0022DDE69F|nr:hypothetical protein [Algoriphagus sp. TR-M9]WBL42406.1 hypothetical protein PBT90_16845 [Algoriphagus sp. TR-M9]WBL43083.1 hypothetical protein PBT90_20360 [Algoriphagus sp. TR-M9]
MAENPISEIQSYVQSWADRTDQVLLQMMKRLGVGITEELFKSVQSRVYAQASAMIGYDLSFLTYGRFRDMNVGRGRGKDLSLKFESTTTNREIIQGKNRKRSKVAKWYSRPFYGRLNALEGAIGIQMMEQSIRAVKTPLTDD